MPKTKYPPEAKKKAENEFRTIFLENPTIPRWKAVERVSSRYPYVKPTTLAFWAYGVKRELRLSRKGSQHPLHTSHGNLMVKLKQMFEADGYDVKIEENAIRRYMKEKGSNGHPDLLAKKENDVILVEIVDQAKTQDIIVDQLKRYSNVGRVIVVFPFDTVNIDFWGLQHLKSQIARSTS